MEHLFNTTLPVDHQAIPFEVHFENETYVFTSKDGSGATEVRLRREHDEWHCNGQASTATKAAAATALDNYLMKQH